MRGSHAVAICTAVWKPKVTSVIGNGVVVYPPRFREEVEQLRAAGVEVGKNLLVSDHAHVIFPYHMEEERFAEADAGGTIGTTAWGSPSSRTEARNASVRSAMNVSAAGSSPSSSSLVVTRDSPAGMSRIPLAASRLL